MRETSLQRGRTPARTPGIKEAGINRMMLYIEGAGPIGHSARRIAVATPLSSTRRAAGVRRRSTSPIEIAKPTRG